MGEKISNRDELLLRSTDVLIEIGDLILKKDKEIPICNERVRILQLVLSPAAGLLLGFDEREEYRQFRQYMESDKEIRTGMEKAQYLFGSWENDFLWLTINYWEPIDESRTTAVNINERFADKLIRCGLHGEKNIPKLEVKADRLWKLFFKLTAHCLEHHNCFTPNQFLAERANRKVPYDVDLGVKISVVDLLKKQKLDSALKIPMEVIEEIFRKPLDETGSSPSSVVRQYIVDESSVEIDGLVEVLQKPFYERGKELNAYLEYVQRWVKTNFDSDISLEHAFVQVQSIIFYHDFFAAKHMLAIPVKRENTYCIILFCSKKRLLAEEKRTLNSFVDMLLGKTLAQDYARLRAMNLFKFANEIREFADDYPPSNPELDTLGKWFEMLFSVIGKYPKFEDSSQDNQKKKRESLDKTYQSCQNVGITWVTGNLWDPIENRRVPWLRFNPKALIYLLGKPKSSTAEEELYVRFLKVCAWFFDITFRLEQNGLYTLNQFLSLRAKRKVSIEVRTLSDETCLYYIPKKNPSLPIMLLPEGRLHAYLRGTNFFQKFSDFLDNFQLSAAEIKFIEEFMPMFLDRSKRRSRRYNGSTLAGLNGMFEPLWQEFEKLLREWEQNPPSEIAEVVGDVQSYIREEFGNENDATPLQARVIAITTFLFMHPLHTRFLYSFPYKIGDTCCILSFGTTKRLVLPEIGIWQSVTDKAFGYALTQRLLEEKQGDASKEVSGTYGHEIRNDATGIANAFRLLEPYLDTGINRVANALDIVSRRIAGIKAKVEYLRTGRSKALVPPRDVTTHWQLLDIQKLIEDALKQIYMDAEAEGATLYLELDMKELPPIYGVEYQVWGVFYNLLRNALHAIEENKDKKGDIIIHAEALPESIQITIEDTGPGLPPDFNPEACCKRYGKGNTVRESIKFYGN